MSFYKGLQVHEDTWVADNWETNDTHNFEGQ